MPTPTASRPLNPSGTTVPIWYEGRDEGRAFGPLRQSLRTEVCIVGAGIAGLTTAYLLARAGKGVAVIDEKPVGGGESGRTSAHLASALDDRFSRMERMHGAAATALHYQSHAAAIDLIEQIDREEKLGSDFARLDGYLFLADGQEVSDLEQEAAAASRVGVDGVELLERPSIPGVLTRPCIRFPRQGRFQPLVYLKRLSEVLERMGVAIHCGDRVMDLRGDGPVLAKLKSGLEVHADFGVSATNIPTPINNWIGIYTKQASYRTYMIALEVVSGDLPDALYWDFEDPYHYARLHRIGERIVLLVGGEDHKTGQEEPDVDHFARLQAWAHVAFRGLGEVVSRWSGQVNEPDDGAAFIGRAPTKGNAACYVITGDSGMGLTHGTLGAMLVKDLILGRENPWAEIYDPERKPRSLAATGAFLEENVNAVAQMKDLVTRGDVKSSDEIPTGAGAVVREGVHKLAVYRDESGQLHKCSAICPHLKCVVRWNHVEQSWDCPCHGSRFDAFGRLINGPAVDDLAPVQDGG